VRGQVTKRQRDKGIKWRRGTFTHLFLCCLPVFIPVLVHAGTSQEYFARGNQAYESGDYQSAIGLYDSSLAQAGSAAALYNRGNACFKSGQVGRAIADYNRAHVLAPADRDITNNLEFARQYRPDKTTAVENPLVRLSTNILRVLSYSTTRLLAGLLFFAAFATLALLFVTGNRWYGLSAIVPGVLFLYCLAATLSWRADINPARAVVVVPEVTLRSGPGDEYKEMVVVHDGLEVTIASRRANHVLVQAPGGLGGWTPAASVEVIFPAR